MKKWVFNSILLLLLTVAWQTSLQANRPIAPDSGLFKKEFTKTIDKSFDISANGTVDLSSKFGEIKVVTGAENRVVIKVDIVVHANSEDRAKQVFDRIDVDFSNGADYVSAKTEIESRSNGWNWWGSSNNSDFEINYEVRMPKTARLDLEMRHGDAFVAALDGEVQINVAHGSFRLEGGEANMGIELAHGKGNIIQANNAEVEIRHSKLHFKNANQVEVESRHSRVEIDQAARVKSNSAHDTYEIGTVNEFRNEGRHDNFDIDQVNIIEVDAKYSDFDVKGISQRGEFDLQFGGLDLDKLSKGFSELKMSGSHSNFRLEVEDGAAYRFEAYGTHAGINYPSNMEVHMEKEKNTSHEVEGYVGQQDANSMIKVRLSHGNVKLR
ncbi:MAG: hypothetical protein AAFP19_04100 [Bacteroidota bacterium]